MGRWVDLACLMTSGLSKDIRCHVWPYCSKLYGAEREGERKEGQRERGREVEVDGFALMTPGLSKDIRCHV